MNLVEQGPVYMLSHAIVLWYVWGCYLVSNALVLEVLLQFTGDILAPSIGMEGHNMVPCLNFSPFHKHLEAFCNLRFEFNAVNKDFSRLVVNPCHKVNKVVV